MAETTKMTSEGTPEVDNSVGGEVVAIQGEKHQPTANTERGPNIGAETSEQKLAPANLVACEMTKPERSSAGKDGMESVYGTTVKPTGDERAMKIINSIGQTTDPERTNNLIERFKKGFEILQRRKLKEAA